MSVQTVQKSNTPHRQKVSRSHVFLVLLTRWALEHEWNTTIFSTSQQNVRDAVPWLPLAAVPEQEMRATAAGPRLPTPVSQPSPVCPARRKPRYSWMPL